MSVTERRSGRASGGGAGAGRGEGFTVMGAFERARPGEILTAARDDLSQRLFSDIGKPQHEARGDRRRAGGLGGAGRMTSGAPSAWAKSCAARPDAPLLWVENPSFARIGRDSHGSLRVSGGQLPSLEPTEHHAVGGSQARFQRPEDAHAHVK